MTIKLTRISDAKYNEQADLLRGTDFRKLVSQYPNHVYNAALRYIETGDVAILNHVNALSKFMPAKRLSAALIRVFACHTLKNGKYSGKASKTKLAALRKDPTIIQDRMTSILEKDANAKQDKEPAPFVQDKADKALARALAKYILNGAVPDMKAIMQEAEALADKAQEKTKPAPVATPEEIGASAREAA